MWETSNGVSRVTPLIPQRYSCAARTAGMAASTSTPMEMAIPPKDMMFAPSPCHRMMMKASRIDSGIETMATKAERKWKRNS